jgi:hypothetical protein
MDIYIQINNVRVEPEQRFSSRILKNFIDFWDDEIRAWFALNGNPTVNCQKWQKIIHNIHPELMPEPYWGNPEESSVVVINYNPGSSETVDEDDPCHINQAKNQNHLTMAGAMHKKYSDIALSFPWLDSQLTGFCQNAKHARTLDWMRKRTEWAYRVCNITTPLHAQPRPFLFDLCGWHGHSWNGNIDELDVKILDSLKAFISVAIDHSQKNLGLCVGAAFNTILPQLGYKDYTKSITGYDEWQPIDNNNRKYKAYRHPNGTRIICTLAQGSNICPDAKFQGHEQWLESML